jgi:hypothetical protein
VFKVGFVLSFLVFITGVSSYLIYPFYQIGLFHFFSIVFILLIRGIQKGVFKRIINTVKKAR